MDVVSNHADRAVFDTATVAPPARSDFWRRAVACSCYPMDIQFSNREAFSAKLSMLNLGDFSLSRGTTSALRYTRSGTHIKNDPNECYLVTIPSVSSVRFSQRDVSVTCAPGELILERSHEPYEFSHDDPVDLRVLRLPAWILRGHLRSPERFCAVRFNAAEGVGRLLVDFLDLIPARFEQLQPSARIALGQQVTELLVLALTSDDRALTTGASSVRNAHLARIEAYVRRHIGSCDLDPVQIAVACGISVRYLHQLFRDTGQPLCEWMRQQRLTMSCEALHDPAEKGTIAEIALRCGFREHAQFSRLFKQRFGLTPTEHRRARS